MVVMAASLFQVTHEGTVFLGVDRAEVRDHMQYLLTNEFLNYRSALSACLWLRYIPSRAA